MSFLKRLGAIIFCWQMLACIGLVLLACGVWLIGPLLEFGQYRPLVGVGLRALLILMLLGVPLFMLLGWPLSAIAVAAICLLIWHAGPLLAVAAYKPLEPAATRLLIIVVLALLYLVYAAYLLWQAVRNNDQLLQRILHPRGEQAATLAQEEMRAVAAIVGVALRRLKQMRSNVGVLRRVFESRRYLYELPWFLVIGSSGSGKTTAIAQSGLQFPVTDTAGAGIVHAVTGHCEWWMANEAVLIDTAGRYTRQEENAGGKAADVNAAEWRGFLGLLRKHRPRAPVNAALLVLSAAEILAQPEAERAAMGAALRTRLAELRAELGIRFPVYVLITKLDLLEGFAEYFQSLTAEGRAQLWGFALPWQADAALPDSAALRNRCAGELGALESRLDSGLNERLMEEYENAARKRMAVFPQEFRSLSDALIPLLEQVFLDSRYDNTQLNATLRGVYLCSALQTGRVIAAAQNSVLARLRKVLPHMAWAGGAPTGNQGYFLARLFQQLMVADAHLVRPNLRWQFRFRMIRLLSHALVLGVFAWLACALMVSHTLNQGWLATLNQKTDALAARVQAFYKSPSPAGIPDVLAAAHDLPYAKALDPEQPPLDWQYGLYSAPPVVASAQGAYAALETHLLLPQLVQRIETALGQAVEAKDVEAAYGTLSIYLMLFDKAHFDGAAVKAWVRRDWERTDSASVYGNQASMAAHLDALFADGQVVQSPFVKNEGLVERTRALLDASPTTSRLYERTKAALLKEAPEDFTLTRALGPLAGAVFAMNSGVPVGHGIPGLFTYAGYHDVFSARLPGFVEQAQREDAWVMGGTSAAALALRGVHDSLVDEIRRLYLVEYAGHWQAFLDDIRTVGSTADAANGTLALDLQTLRLLASPDSPLTRLARAAAHETTLSVLANPVVSALTDKAVAALDKKSGGTLAAAGLRPEQKLEKELVDSHFAALREVVTGQADSASAAIAGSNTSQRGLQLDALIGLINEQYTLLVVADNALSSNSLPPVADISARLRIEAARLPAPFQAVLNGLAISAAYKVNQGVGTLLARQMEATVGDTCRLAIEGKYPFAPGEQEVDADDFTRVFASGGVLDDFFQKNLASHVDTSTKPWRYKVASADMPAIHGPDLEAFQRAMLIRDAFFTEPGAKRMGWKMNVRFATVDPKILRLALDIDGQSARYSHGPVVPFNVAWPGPRGGVMAQISASPAVRPETSTLISNGPWALFRLLEKGKVSPSASSGRVAVDFDLDGRHAVLDLQMARSGNPLTTDLFRGFHCPGSSV